MSTQVVSAIQTIRDLPRMTPKEALSSPAILNARKVLKKEKNPSLSQELIAARLGLYAHQLPQDFIAFAEKRCLPNYLAAYDHTIKVVNEDLVIGPKEQRWSEIKELALKTLPNEDNKFVRPWVYGNEGIQEICDMYEWNELRPFKRDNPEKWGGGYAMQFCTTVTKEPRLQGDHTFIRLCTPTGEVYSVGLYRPEKRCTLDSWFLPLRIKPASLMNPDVSEFWGVEIQEVTIAINEDDFKAKKRQIEEDNQSRLLFHPLGQNCTSWSLKIGKISGICLNCESMAPRVLVHSRLVKLTDNYFDKLPKVIQKVCIFAVTLIFNLISLAGGSFWVDKKMKGADPHLPNLFDLASAEKLVIQSPHKLGTEVIPKIEKWRLETIKELQSQKATEEDIKKVRFGLPPATYWESAS